MNNLIGITLLVVSLAVAVVILKPEKLRGVKGLGSGPLPFRRKDYLLSKAERSFYLVLLQAVGAHWRVFPKVRLIDLVWLPRDTPNAQSHRNRVQSKHVDFVLCSNDALRPELVIELDDASHEREDRVDRDALVDRILQSAGLPILHVSAARSYTTAELAKQIQSLMGGSPPIASSQTVPNLNA